jgi:hypothetical protein
MVDELLELDEITALDELLAELAVLHTRPPKLVG